MERTPVKNLNQCSVHGCQSLSQVLVEKKMGEDKIVFGYCEFHSIISATFFSKDKRTEIRL